MGGWVRVVYVWKLIIEFDLVETRFVDLAWPYLAFFIPVFL